MLSVARSWTLDSYKAAYSRVLHCPATPYKPWGGNEPRFICWFWRYINCVFCLFTCLPSFLPYFLLSLYFLPYLVTSLLIYFLIYLSTSSRIGLFHFQAGGRRRLPNIAVVFLGSLYVVYILLWMHICFSCVWFWFFVTKPIDCLVRTSPKWPILCQVGR